MKLDKKWCKISVRCTVAVCVTIAIIILVLFASSIGYANSLVVFAAFLMCGLIAICIELVHVLLNSVYRTSGSKALNIDGRTVKESTNFKKPTQTSEEELQQSFDLFLLKNKFKNICISTCVKGTRRNRMKKTYVVRYADLMSDLFMFTVYLIILALIVLSFRDSSAFYSTRVSMRQFMSRSYFNNETREPITVKLFLEYLQHDFLPTIHTGKLKIFSIASHNQSNGWLRDNHVKILGIARLRQQRVIKASCKHYGKFGTNCVPMLHETTEDKTDYDPSWKKQTKTHLREKYWRILQPWIYQNTFQTQSVPQFGKSFLYSGGGYTCNLGRTLANSLSVLKFIREQHWIDRQTKVIFIEFTTYGADSNIFNVITLIAERTGIGYFEFSYNIQSVQLLTIIENLSGTTILLYMSYLVMNFVFVYRMIFSLLETNAKQHFAKIWNIIDLIIVAQSVGMVTIFFIRNQYVRSLLVQLERTRNNEFVSFLFAAFLDQLMLWWSGFLVCISTIRIWKILNFIFIFRVFSKTLVNAARELFASTVTTMLFVTCFGMLFYQLNSFKSAPFSSLSKSFSSLIAILFGFVTDRLSSADIFSGTNWIELLIFVVSLAVVAIYLINMIITISCTYFSNVRREAKLVEKDELSFCDFLRDEYYNMFHQGKQTSRRVMNIKCASLRESQERLEHLEKRLNKKFKSVEELFCKNYKIGN